MGRTKKEIANRFGVSPSYFSDAIALRRIPEEIQQKVPRGTFRSLLEVLASIEDPSGQEKLAEKMGQGITVREAQAFASSLKAPFDEEELHEPPAKIPPGLSTDTPTKTPGKPPKKKGTRKAKFHCDFCGPRLDYMVHGVPGRGLVCNSCGRDVEVGEVDEKPEAPPPTKEPKPWWTQFEDVVPQDVVKDVTGFCQIGGAKRKQRFLRIYLGQLRAYVSDANQISVTLLEAEKTLSELESGELERRP